VSTFGLGMIVGGLIGIVGTMWIVGRAARRVGDELRKSGRLRDD
jgi:F0F1-type ATP synthase assembly protein I